MKLTQNQTLSIVYSESESEKAKEIADSYREDEWKLKNHQEPNTGKNGFYLFQKKEVISS